MHKRFLNCIIRNLPRLEKSRKKSRNHVAKTKWLKSLACVFSAKDHKGEAKRLIRKMKFGVPIDHVETSVDQTKDPHIKSLTFTIYFHEKKKVTVSPNRFKIPA